jgi:hypothetical protein
VRKVRILVLSPPALSQLIEHLFRDRPEFEVVARLSVLRRMGEEAGRLCPDLIVANVKPVSTAVCQAVASIKRSSPLSKLILICPARDFMASARRCGADACLEQEELVRRLSRTAWALSERTVAGFQELKNPGVTGPKKRWNQKGEISGKALSDNLVFGIRVTNRFNGDCLSAVDEEEFRPSRC